MMKFAFFILMFISPLYSVEGNAESPILENGVYTTHFTYADMIFIWNVRLTKISSDEVLGDTYKVEGSVDPGDWPSDKSLTFTVYSTLHKGTLRFVIPDKEGRVIICSVNANRRSIETIADRKFNNWDGEVLSNVDSHDIGILQKTSMRFTLELK